MSKKMNTAKTCYDKGSSTVFWAPLPFGATSVGLFGGPLIASITWLTSLPQDFHANRFQSQEKDQEKKMLGICGQKQLNVFALYDQNTHCWKTSQGSFNQIISEEFSETWPNQGMMQLGLCWELPTSVQTTKEKDCGYWPTPDYSARGARSAEGMTKGHQVNLADAVRHWATPTVKGNYNRKGLSKTSGDGLSTQVGGKLNPPWVEWLMGWPIGYTDLKPLAMDKFLSQWLSHFQNYLKELIDNK